MKLNECIKELIKMCNTTQTKVAEDNEMKQGAFATMMKRNNMQVKTLVGIAESLDYEVVLRPKNGTGKNERSVVIDMAGEE